LVRRWWVATATVLPLLAAAPAPAATPYNYAPTDQAFHNPERGLYGYCPLTDPGIDHAALRQSGVTLCYASILLNCCRTSPIDATTLDTVGNGLAGLRAAGLKGIVRIVYDNTSSGQDATLAWVDSHLQQLQPVLDANADVIAFFQAGVIGAWGEWHSSKQSLDTPSGRADVWSLLKYWLPPDSFIQIRTPAFVYELEGANLPLDDATGFTGTGAARAGHHNDCWLASDTDYGTYESAADREAWLQTLESDDLYVPWGGETCATSPLAACTTALDEASRLHATYLNRDYHPTVISNLAPCWDEIERRLGYRFELESATLPDSIAAGQDFCYRVRLRNLGWAPPYNQRPVFLRLFAPGSPAAAEVDAEEDYTTWWGQVSGDYRDTFASDDVYQTITEGLSNEKPANRTSQVAHFWSFQVPAGTGTALHMEAHHSANGESDDFQISYSLDGTTYLPAMAVTKTTDDDSLQSVQLPGPVSGALRVRAEDMDRGQGNQALDSLFVDRLFISVEGAGGGQQAVVLADYPLTADPRFWRPEAGTIELEGSVTAPAVLEGSTVGLALWLPDADPEIRSRSEYSLRLANVGVWSAAMGHNVLVDGIPVGGADPELCNLDPQATSVHVSDIAVESLSLGGGAKTGRATVTVVDDLLQPAAGTMVQGHFTGGVNQAVSATADVGGVAVLTGSETKKGRLNVTFCVDALEQDGLVYEAGANLETCDTN
jgi:hypothetical protein